MRWSFKLAHIAGIDVRIHATFFLLLAWVAWGSGIQGGTPAALAGVILVCLVFLCVLLHEFGHALAARRYGIRTPDITLLPIGGVARLERMPDKPVQEFVVAIAGPLVNVAIAAALGLYLWVFDRLPHHNSIGQFQGSLPQLLFLMNAWLVVFNLIPAFPMDGGRILRAFLATRMEYARATHIAASIGQFCAFGFGFYGLIKDHPTLVLVAVFVYFGAASEAAHAEMKAFSNGLRVNAAMVTHFQALPLSATLDAAIEALLRTSQHEFPIVDPAGSVRGLLTRDDLIVALRKSGPDTPVAEVMRVGIPCVHQSMHFDRAFALMQESDCPALPVLDSAGQLVGLFTPENVGEMVMIQSALAKGPKQARPTRRVAPPPLSIE
jgi:Zn-dependent protease/CBS domain-containing protein